MCIAQIYSHLLYFMRINNPGDEFYFLKHPSEDSYSAIVGLKCEKHRDQSDKLEVSINKSIGIRRDYLPKPLEKLACVWMGKRSPKPGSSIQCHKKHPLGYRFRQALYSGTPKGT